MDQRSSTVTSALGGAAAIGLAWLDAHHLTLDVIALSILIATLYKNWFWRALCVAASYKALGAVPGAEVLPAWGFAVLAVVIMNIPPLRFYACFRAQPEEGCVFVTGADSGMGEATVLLLSTKPGYEVVYAGCFLESSFDVLKAKVKSAGGDEYKVVPVLLDVTSDESVTDAATTVETDLATRKPAVGLIGVINCAGMGFSGPAEYFPIEMYKRQMDVNFFGYIRVVQAFMPLVKAATSVPGVRRGRVVFIGTGGGILSPGPPLLTAYMASKWAIEAFCRSMRVEMQLRELPIDCCMVNRARTARARPPRPLSRRAPAC